VEKKEESGMKKLMFVVVLGLVMVSANFAHAQTGELEVDGDTSLATTSGNVILTSTTAGTGHVGVGTAAPVDTVGFGKAVDIQSTTGGAVYCGNGTVRFLAGGDTIRGSVGTNSSHPLWVKTGGTERLCIDATGNVGIGVTDPETKLEINNTAVFSSEHNAGTFVAGASVDWRNGNKQRLTLSGNTVNHNMSFTDIPGSVAANYVLRIIHSGDNNTVSWPGGIKWKGGTAPTLSTASGKHDLIVFYYSGSSYYGSAVTGF